MNRRTGFLLLVTLSTPLTRVAAQEPSLAIGPWSGCFQTAQEAERSACGTIIMDSSRVCGHLANATYTIPFDSLELPSGEQIPKQGSFSWHNVTGSRVAFYSATTAAETATGEPVCVMGTIYLEAWGSLEGDSLTGEWTWGSRTERKTGGTFKLTRSR